MNEELIQKLRFLADKYENKSFIAADPSQFIYWYKAPEEIETASFIAAMLSFGNRKQFIPKIAQIFQLADRAGGINSWLLSKAYETEFVASGWEYNSTLKLNAADNHNLLQKSNLEPKFYRFYSYSDMRDLFDCLNKILTADGTLGKSLKNFAASQMNSTTSTAETVVNGNLNSNSTKNSICTSNSKPMYLIIQDFFQQFFAEAAIVPKGKASANKRIHMFLRWMVRQNSPVDAGLWSWYPADELLIPLDVHVMQEAVKLGLLPENASASFKTAIQLTQKMAEVFPSDPSRADFALFGLGVDIDSK